MYVRAYAPVVASEKHGRYLPVYVVYNDLKTLLSSSSEQREYYHEIFGDETVLSAPSRYWDLSMITEKGIPIHEWDNPHLYNAKRKAELRAYFALYSMVHAVETHYRRQREERNRQKKNG